MKLLPSTGGSLAKRFARAAAILSAAIIVMTALSSFWLLSQQRTLAVRALQQKEAAFHAKAASAILSAIAGRMSELADNPILATGLVDSAGRETYLIPFLQAVRQIDGVPVEVMFTDFEGQEIGRNGPLTFSVPQLEWLRQQLANSTEAAAVFSGPGDDELIAVELLRYSRTQSPEGAVLYKINLNDLKPAPATRLLWAGMSAGLTEREAGALAIDTPPLFKPLGLRLVELPEGAGASLGNSWPQAILIVLVALALAAIVYVLASRLAESLTSDVRRLEEFAGGLRDEDLSVQRAPLSGSDEVVSLARSLNRMLDRLYRQQAQLKQENDKFYALANTIPQLAWMADPDGSITWFNERWYTYTGTTEEQAKGWGWQSVQDPEVLPEILRNWKQAIATGQAVQMTFPLRGADGVFRPFYTSVAPLRNEAGDIVQWFGTNTDLSPIMQAERALRESEERLQQGLIAGHMAVWDWEITTGQLRFAANLESVFGYSWDQVELAWSQVHPEDMPQLRQAIADAVQQRGQYHVTVRIERPGHAVAWLELRGKVLPDKAGNPDLMQAVAIDVSERKRAEEALQNADRRKDEFLAMLAHELRNPLAPISTAAQLLNLTFASEPKVKQASEIISRQVGHMTRLVDDLLDVSRVTRGLVSLKKERLELGQIIAGAVDQTRPLVEAKHHHLAVQPLSEPVYVEGDQTRLIQVLANLLGNAARYTQENGQIWLDAKLLPDHVELTVRDNGSGIEAGLLPHVFELFTQGKRTPDRSQGGLGVGLALVKKLVELHGGTVQASSPGPGQGSRFTVILPRSTVQARQAAHPPAEIEPTQRLRIMVVDDNTDAADTLTILLEVIGHQVAVAYSAQQALALARAADLPDVFLLDIGLPDMDGHELVRHLQQLPGAARSVFVALTGYGQEQDIRRSKASGFHHHLIKPVNGPALVRLLQEVGAKLPSLADQ